MTGPQLIVLATPVFLLLIGLELFIGWRRGRLGYRLNDALSSIGLGVLSQVVGVFSAAITLGLYAMLHERWAVASWPATHPAVWVVALVAYDFCYYWHHRLGHTVALLWAAHAVHHQSEDYNLSTALRQTGTGWVAGWVFYLPLALAGVPPLVFGGVALVDLLYQYWVHTQQIGRLGWFDRWFCAPSNHRVHHAVNDVYLDRNFGGILLVWDRLFGTWQPERDDVPCVYGSRGPLRSWNPLWANLQVYAALAHDSWHAARWSDKLAVWWRPPGWRPADVAARWPKPPFDVATVQRHDPPMTRAASLAAAGTFAGVLAGAAWWLWHADAWPHPVAVAGAAVLVAGLCLVAWLCHGEVAGERARLPRGDAPGADRVAG